MDCVNVSFWLRVVQIKFLDIERNYVAMKSG